MAELEQLIKSRKEDLQRLDYDCAMYERLRSTHNIAISKVRQLEEMGLGIPQFITLHDTAHEVAKAYGISHDRAIQKLLNDIVENYAEATDLEGRVKALSSERIKIENEITKYNLALGSFKGHIELLAQLLSLGYSQS